VPDRRTRIEPAAHVVAMMKLKASVGFQAKYELDSDTVELGTQNHDTLWRYQQFFEKHEVFNNLQVPSVVRYPTKLDPTPCRLAIFGASVIRG
jgi:hypothetical protein